MAKYYPLPPLSFATARGEDPVSKGKNLYCDYRFRKIKYENFQRRGGRSEDGHTLPPAPDPGPMPAGAIPNSCGGGGGIDDFLPGLILGGGAIGILAPLAFGGAAASGAGASSASVAGAGVSAGGGQVGASLLTTLQGYGSTVLGGIKAATAAAGILKSANSLIKGISLPKGGPAPAVIDTHGGTPLAAPENKPGILGFPTIVWIGAGGLLLLVVLMKGK